MNLKPSLRKLIPAGVMVTLGLYLLSRIWTGALFFYISQRFAWLTWVGGICCILVGIGFALRSSHDHHDHGDHQHSGFTLAGIALVLLTVSLGIFIPPQPLGAAAMANREVRFSALTTNSATGARLSSLAAPGSSPELSGDLRVRHNILDWLIAFEQSSDLSTFVGQEATVQGFVFRDQRHPDQDGFTVSRFVVSCCVADASAVGMMVRWPDADGLAEDQWVEVKGRFEIGEFDGKQQLYLVAEDVSPIETPAQPYLFF